MTPRSVSLGVSFLLGFGLLHGLDLGQLFNGQSFIIVIGGTALVLWLSFPPRRVGQTFRAVQTALERPPGIGTTTLLPPILDLARIYRLHGLLALQRSTRDIEHDFLRFGATLIVEGYDESALTAALEREDALRQ